jgi:hypothetical protein
MCCVQACVYELNRARNVSRRYACLTMETVWRYCAGVALSGIRDLFIVHARGKVYWFVNINLLRDSSLEFSQRMLIVCMRCM